MSEDRIALDTLTDENVDDNPPCVLVYGPEGVGKTSLASEAIRPVFFRIERGMPKGVRQPGWNISSYSKLMDGISTLYTDDHDFGTLAIDNLTDLERKVVWPETCLRGDEKGAWRDIEAPGFGKGYAMAMALWEELFEGLDGLRGRGMSIILIGHSLVKEFKDPENQTHNVYDIALQDSQKVSAARYVKQKSDAVFLIKKDVSVEKEDPNNKFNKRVIAKGGQARWIYTEGRPAFAAKNRYGMPEKIPYRRGEGFQAIAEHIPFWQAESPASKAAA